MPESYQLPLKFDPDRLAADLARVQPDEWIAHFNKQEYVGLWRGAALRAIGGAQGNIYPDPSSQKQFADTPLLARCPYFREVLARIECPLRAVRLLLLGPGARIREHRDIQLSPADGEVRLHIPITTNPDVQFVVNGNPMVMNPGETWFINFNLPHRIRNRGTTDRVHLVIDCAVTDWLLNLLPAEVPELPSAALEELPRSPESLERFRQVVLNDPDLAEELRDTADRELFIRRTVQLAEARGYRFSPLDVMDAMRTGHQAWLQRSIV